MKNKKEAEMIIDSIINTFNGYVKKNLFTEDFIGPKYYSSGRSHSRVLGILIQSFHKLGYIVDVERSIKFDGPYKPKNRKRAMYQYRPDITIVDKKDAIVGIAEYESIDATDKHLFKKIEYFDYAIPANPSIKQILFLPTLTTLKYAPQKWIETNRKIYMNPIKNRLNLLSQKYPKIDVIYGILDEHGLRFIVMKDGNIELDKKEQIFKQK